MSLRERTRPGLGTVEPCPPSPAKVPPSSPGWLREIKHDGFRILARRDGAAVRLSRQPIEERKRLLDKLLKGSHLSIVLNEHFEEDGASVYKAACQLGCEGIVSNRLGSTYRSGRSPHWVKGQVSDCACCEARG